MSSRSFYKEKLGVFLLDYNGNNSLLLISSNFFCDMGSNGCFNGSLAGANYSSPVPVIGLYVAGASFVCLLMMLYDIVTGFLRRTRWLPNFFFKLNSVTLTLLSIATKLTVDLTTPMPSSLDQLSKLSGTAFICVTIGFLLPSLATTGETECKTNLVALAIFVITVIVNICIQISTKVITLFIVEHVLILCCMLLLLIEAWGLASDVNLTKGDPIDRNKELLTQGNKSLFQRVKICYVNMYQGDSQFVMCRHIGGGKYSGLCIMSSSILVQAAVRSIVLKQLKFCSGTSDYDWSMSPLVHIQILTVVLACFVISFRWISMYSLLDIDQGSQGIIGRFDTALPLLKSRFLVRLRFWSSFLVIVPSTLFVLLPNMLMHVLGGLFLHLPSLGLFKAKLDEKETMEDFKDLFVESGKNDGDEWILSKSVTNMKKLIAICDKDPPSHLLHFLSRTSPSDQASSMEISETASHSQQAQVIQVSPISIVLLLKIVQASIPEHLCTSLIQALGDANGIYQYVYFLLYCTSYKKKGRLSMANFVFANYDFRSFLPDIFNAQDEEKPPESDLERAITIITKLRSTLPSDGMWDEVSIVTDFINRRRYSSIEDLYSSLEQLIVDMLHALFSQLPIAIFKSLNESSAEDYPGRVTYALAILCKVQSLEAQIQWSFPADSNISTLITDEMCDTLGV